MKALMVVLSTMKKHAQCRIKCNIKSHKNKTKQNKNKNAKIVNTGNAQQAFTCEIKTKQKKNLHKKTEQRIKK